VSVADPVADALAEELEALAGGGARAILLFGSRLAGTAPSPHSAYDLVLIVDAYRPFYERLHALGRHRRGPATLTALARVLPPNILAFDPGLPDGQIAKVMILTAGDFARALSPRAPDHFLRGRLVQRVAVLRARDAGVREEVERLLANARRDVLRWAAPWLPERFAATDLARRMLEVSYAGEVRPESAGRVAAVFEAQRPYLEETYGAVLADAERRGTVVRVPGDDGDGPAWRLAAPPGAAGRAGWRLYFARSKIRATTRWLKHVATFDDWVTYIQRKVERRTGIRVEVTPLERRFALILLWPKALGVLRELRRSRRSGPRPDGLE
jgi:hypothetical protein